MKVFLEQIENLNELLPQESIERFDYSLITYDEMVFPSVYSISTLYESVISSGEYNDKRILNYILCILFLYNGDEGYDRELLGSMTDLDVLNLRNIAKNIHQEVLKFKIYVLFSEKIKRESKKYEEIAIQIVLNFKLRHERWYHYHEPCLRKAALLCKKKHHNNSQYKSELKKHLIKAMDCLIIKLNKNKIKDIYLLKNLFSLLMDTGVLEINKLVVKIKRANKIIPACGNTEQIESYYLLESELHNKNKDQESYNICMKKLGELYYFIAIENIEGGHYSKLVFLTKAINYLRRIPKKVRDYYNVNFILSNIEILLQPVGFDVVNNMNEIRASSSIKDNEMDSIKSEIESRINNQDCFVNSFVAMLFLFKRIKKKEILALKERTLSGFIGRQIADCLFFSKDGRVINRAKAISFGGGFDMEKYADECSDLFSLDAALKSQLYILPAIDILNKKYSNFDEVNAGLDLIVDNSLLIPPDRKCIFKKIIKFGLNEDFQTAIHLLCPQIENFVRWILKLNNVSTTVINSEQIEMEAGLSTLLDKEQASKVFDEDFLFEMKMLLSSQYGPNLRNEIAHGLIDDSTSQQQCVVYVWWSFMRVVISGCFNDWKECD
ncbi:DUF4209 domain-containing protein [Morganella morganii]|uniref:DUF4209 domain-containing protein n=1 Tax=Morganella morganii TaxID=582 RepID=UPI00280F8C9C|nr:DUF4209 domain-containing protein [Morganella morganii]